MVENYDPDLEGFEDLDEWHEMAVKEALGDRIGSLLIEYDYGSLESIKFANDEELLDIQGIGTSTLKLIREGVRSALEEGVSDQPATADAEVKPYNEEADPAEGEIAESPSAVEAGIVGSYDLESGDVAIRSLWPAQIKVTAPSGRRYLWPSSGAMTIVKAEDIAFVMGKNRNVGRACCGSSGERTYFELA